MESVQPNELFRLECHDSFTGESQRGGGGTPPRPGGANSAFQAVDAALALQSREAQLFGRFHFVQGLGRVPVADRDISLVPEWMVGKRVRLEIQVHVAV